MHVTTCFKNTSGDAHIMAVLPPVTEDREDLSENHVK